MIDIKFPKNLVLPSSDEIQRSIAGIINDLATKFVKEVQSNILREKLTDRGVLLKSVKIVKLDPTEILVVSTEAKAPTIEFGRRPGSFPPVKTLEEWVLRKGIQEQIEVTTPKELRAARRLLRKDARKLATNIAWKIAKKIQKEGTKERKFWRPAISTIEREEGKKKLTDFAKQILSKIYLK